jgi:hypothetical protein
MFEPCLDWKTRLCCKGGGEPCWAVSCHWAVIELYVLRPGGTIPVHEENICAGQAWQSTKRGHFGCTTVLLRWFLFFLSFFPMSQMMTYLTSLLCHNVPVLCGCFPCTCLKISSMDSTSFEFCIVCMHLILKPEHFFQRYLASIVGSEFARWKPQRSSNSTAPLMLEACWMALRQRDLLQIYSEYQYCINYTELRLILQVHTDVDWFSTASELGSKTLHT